MKSYVQPGKEINYYSSGGNNVDDVVVMGGMVGVCQQNFAAGETRPVLIRGVVQLPKNTGEVWTPGQALFWDASNSWLSNVPTAALIPAGYAENAHLSADVKGEVNLQPGAFAQMAKVNASTGTAISGFTAADAMTSCPHTATAGGSTPTAAQVDTAVNGAIDALNQLISDLGQKQNAMIANMKAAGLMKNA